jgi:hypothetical protein
MVVALWLSLRQADLCVFENEADSLVQCPAATLNQEVDHHVFSHTTSVTDPTLLKYQFSSCTDRVRRYV